MIIKYVYLHASSDVRMLSVALLVLALCGTALSDPVYRAGAPRWDPYHGQAVFQGKKHARLLKQGAGLDPEVDMNIVS